MASIADEKQKLAQKKALLDLKEKKLRDKEKKQKKIAPNMSTDLMTMSITTDLQDHRKNYLKS